MQFQCSLLKFTDRTEPFIFWTLELIIHRFQQKIGLINE
ncbi:hypothetical protein LLB_3040 [Legionella longbeachae D-4968]|nr:hypothetical protein LLB_3040 [Legionella longbeachae D-4968]